LKDLETYNERLEPDINRTPTKKAYIILEKKLAEMDKEQSKREEIYRIIKEKEEFICKMNHLNYHNSIGIYKKVKYKFDSEKILNIYFDIIKILGSKIYSEDFYHLKSLKSLNGFYFKNTINDYCKATQNHKYAYERQELGSPKKELTLSDIGELKRSIEVREKGIFFEGIEKIEDLFFLELENLINILEVEIKKTKEDLIEKNYDIDLEEWKSGKDNEKYKLLERLEYPSKDDDTKSEELKKIKNNLTDLINIEEDKVLLLELNSRRNSFEMYIFPREVKERVISIKKEEKSERKTKEIDELLEYINQKLKEKRWQYILNGHWDYYLSDFEELNIEVDSSNMKVKLKPGQEKKAKTEVENERN